MLSDDELLDFDLKRLGGFERAPRTLLAEHGDVYRAQLVMARWLDGYRERRAEDKDLRVGVTSPSFEDGVEDTLREIAAHLRQGHFLPGGTLYEDEVSGRRRL